MYRDASEARIIKHGSVELVKLAEAVARGETVPLEKFAEAQRPMFEAPGGARIDTVVLACTHFPLVRDQLVATAPRDIAYIDSGEAIARQTLRMMPPGRPISNGGTGYITDDPAGRTPLVDTLARFGFGDVQQVDTGQSGPARAKRPFVGVVGS